MSLRNCATAQHLCGGKGLNKINEDTITMRSAVRDQRYCIAWVKTCMIIRC